jgi:aromatic ring-opening dioxygenase catalytic subunit (LigB family)
MDGDFRKQFDLLEASLKDIPRTLPERPKAILMATGHWDEDEFTVASSPAPGMVYDYSGFPEHTYRIVYAAPGSPALAARTRVLLKEAGFPSREDKDRGFDHGTFTVAAPMYPAAEVPIGQLSLKSSFDPAEHLAMGRALAPLRDEGVLIIGSGLSFHNLRLFGPAGAAPSIAFDDWLRQTLLRAAPANRAGALENWQNAPAARVVHPREDHLLPLMVAVGAAGDDPATCIYGEAFGGNVRVSSYRFGEDTTPTAFDRAR